MKISPIKRCERPVGLPFQGTFSTAASKIPVDELVEMHASASKAKKKQESTEKCKAGSSKAAKQSNKKKSTDKGKAKQSATTGTSKATSKSTGKARRSKATTFKCVAIDSDED